MIDLDTIRAYCLNFPEAFEDHPWGDTVFKVGKKIFVFVHGADDGLSVTVKLPPELRDLYDQHPSTYVPAYVGRYGWRGVHIRREQDWERGQEAIAVSSRLIAPRRLWAKAGD